MSVLKRSFACWDLNKINHEMPLQIRTEVTISLSTAPGTSTLTVLTVDSMAPIRHLKQLIEPFAYHLYITAVEDPRDLSGRHSRYFSRTQSSLSPRSDRQDSDYESSNDPASPPPNQEREDENLFLRNLLVYIHPEHQVENGGSGLGRQLKDTDCLYEFWPATNQISVLINMENLIFA